MHHLKITLKLALLVAVLFTTLTTFSQELSSQEKDSLTQVWKQKTVKELFSVFRGRNRARDTIKMKMIADIALEKAKKSPNKEDYLTAYRCFGLLYFYKKNNQLGIEYMNKAIPYLKD